MSTPYPPHDGQGGQGHYPGGYGPPPGYGPPSGSHPSQYPGGQSGQVPPGMPQQPYPQQYAQPGQYYYQQPYPHGSFSSDDRTMALLVHLGGLLLGFLLPLVIYLVKKDESAWVRHHAAQAFNFHMTMLIGVFLSFFLMLLFIGFLTLPVVAIVQIVFAILAAVAANKGEWYRYPVAIPMLK